MTSRRQDFKRIHQTLGGTVADDVDHSLVVHGDSLELLQRVPDASVSLILCDPPYHTTKKNNVGGDRAFKEDEDFLGWMEQYAVQWKRVLKMSGTVYVFCSTQMSSRLETTISSHFRPISNITWTKPNEPGYDGWQGKVNKTSLRRWYPHSERILMFEHGSYGTSEAYRRSPLGKYLSGCRKLAGLTAHAVCAKTGAHGDVNHGGAVINWEAGRNVPSREQYRRLAEALEATGRVGEMLDYEDIVRPMNVSRDVEFTDVWNFQSVRPYKGKHPAEKPLDMLMHIITASTYRGDIVLDCFAGSGSTGVAALLVERRAVCMEIDERWVQRCLSRMHTLTDRETEVAR